ncbi:glycosyltransferase [Microbacterium sp. BWT-B31]|uniref:glycosyltransferase n=1 Tax=Microbacterium sp. BWT-B31 TaxID=3232072 RepID=UPI003529ABB6
MAPRVHAILIVRADDHPAAAFHVRRTLAALSRQSLPPHAVTVVLCGDAVRVAEVVTGDAAGASQDGGGGASLDASRIVRAPVGTSFADAVALAVARAGEDADAAPAEALWLLAQDTAPERAALERLVGALERSPAALLAAPKLVRWDDRGEIVSFGVTMTRFGRAVELADGELDQGQHDAVEDVMGADVRGLLVRADAWQTLGGLDPALAGADEGLDLGVRARLAGGRPALAAGAIVAVAGDGVAGPRAPVDAVRRVRGAYASRVAQLHRRLAYAPVAAVPFQWLALLPLALWRTLLRLVQKQPSLVAPEWAAAAVVAVRLGAIGRSRARIRRARTAGWAALAPLRMTQLELRERLEDDPEAAGGAARGGLHFFTGGGAWLVLAALVASVASFTALLAWPVLGGGGMLPLPSHLAALWSDAAFGSRAIGLHTVGPADPFAGIVAAVGSLWPAAPSRALVILWVLAMPLAALGGWFAATRVSDRAVLRLAGGAIWALAPTFLTALVQGRPEAVLLHLLLPWLFFAACAAHRDWVPAGAASVLLATCVACAPVLAPAFAVVWIAALLLVVAVRSARGVGKLIWLVVPTIVVAVPLVWRQLVDGNALGLLADPGAVWAGPQVAADAQGRALLAAGLPTADLAGWSAFLPGEDLWWVPLLAAPVAVLALIAPITQRWGVGIGMLVVTGLGLATAFAAVGIAVAATQSDVVALWPGTGLSLAWLGALAGALVTLDAALGTGRDPADGAAASPNLARRLAAVRGVLAVVVVAAIAVLAVPNLTAMARGTALIHLGDASTLPAFVAAEGRSDPDVGTIVLTPQEAGGVATRVVWGASESLGGQASIVSTRSELTEEDRRTAQLAADLVTSAATDVTGRLGAAGIGFVLLAPAADPESDQARALRLGAATALDQRDGLVAVGDTAKGSLWRVTDAVAPRASAGVSADRIGLWIAIAQLVALGIAVLLAIPTAASRRAARRAPRVVGIHWQEGR